MKGKESFKKVFPGVEFSVGIKSEGVDGRVKQVHVIAIFDDSDEEKSRNCKVFLNWKSTMNKPDRANRRHSSCFLKRLSVIFLRTARGTFA